MEVHPVGGVDELEAHIRKLIEAPETPLEVKLFDDVELQLTETNTPPLIPRLLPPLITALSTTPHDPTPITTLSIKLLRPVTFTQAMSLASEESLILALQSPAVSATLLALTVIEKASRTPSETGILSSMKDLTATLITTWLSHPTVEVGESALRALSYLLETDCAAASQSANPTLNFSINGANTVLRPQLGQGLFWRRLFTDAEIYGSIFKLCSHTPQNTLSTHQTTLAQARLLRLLPTLARLDLTPITTSHFPAIETAYIPATSLTPTPSLLTFAALHMIDKSDILMHITLLDFVRELLTTVSALVLDDGKLGYLRELLGEAVMADEGVRELVKELRARGEVDVSGAEDDGLREVVILLERLGTRS